MRRVWRASWRTAQRRIARPLQSVGMAGPSAMLVMRRYRHKADTHKGVCLVNTQVINLSDGRRVCLSYGVIVAAFLPGQGYVKTAERYSVTTSKHANHFAGRDAPEMAHTALVTACLPVASRL